MKLTKELKSRMVRKILEEKFAAEEKSFEDQFKQLGDDIYNSIPNIELVGTLPDGWLKKVDYLECGFGVCRAYIHTSVDRLMPYNVHNSRINFEADHEFSKRYTAIYAAKKDCSLRKDELRSELNSVLAGVNTDKQLLTIWPEAIKWLPSTSAPVPAVQSVYRLKQLLGDVA